MRIPRHSGVCKLWIDHKTSGEIRVENVPEEMDVLIIRPKLAGSLNVANQRDAHVTIRNKDSRNCINYDQNPNIIELKTCIVEMH
mmetsp:Transcript_4716/g.7248  ORF Transcript_4716/g.7248 Transcript_4716/m.7248 type:complete len:85 (+) Transcript_4716:1333-1587(+)